jgi:hypothetical protein
VQVHEHRLGRPVGILQQDVPRVQIAVEKFQGVQPAKLLGQEAAHAPCGGIAGTFQLDQPVVPDIQRHRRGHLAAEHPTALARAADGHDLDAGRARRPQQMADGRLAPRLIPAPQPAQPVPHIAAVIVLEVIPLPIQEAPPHRARRVGFDAKALFPFVQLGMAQQFQAPLQRPAHGRVGVFQFDAVLGQRRSPRQRARL